MPIELPNLDDRTYDDLAEEARGLIRSYAPAWTDHNPSDPGITVIELFAYLTEMLLYRANRVTEANKIAFLRLIKGDKHWNPARSLNDEIRDAVLQLRTEERVVTARDFERHALSVSGVGRACCLPRRNLEAERPYEDRPGHVSVIVVPQPDSNPFEATKGDLAPRRLITTRVHVVPPRYCAVGVNLTVVLKPDVAASEFVFAIDPICGDQLDDGQVPRPCSEKLAGKLPQSAFVATVKQSSEWLITGINAVGTYALRKEKTSVNVYRDVGRGAIVSALLRFFDPLAGGPNGDGWPFGRAVYVSEIYALLDRLSEVDYVEQTGKEDGTMEDELASPEAWRLERVEGELVAVRLAEDELVEAHIDPARITVVDRQGFQIYGPS